MRELTKNEKILLTILGIVLIGWGSYQFIISPQSQQLEAYNTQKLEYQDKINEMSAVLLKENDIDNGLDRLEKEKVELAAGYFPELDQAQITYSLNDLLAVDHVTITDMNIDRPGYEEMGEFQVKKMDISLSYEGSYMGVMTMMKSLKASPRKILVDNVSMDRQDGGSLVGNIGLKIYGLDEIIDEDDAEEVIKIPAGKWDYGSTPFLAYSSYREDNYSGTDSWEPSDPTNSTGPQGPAESLNPYTPEFSLDYEKENIISLVPGERVK